MKITKIEPVLYEGVRFPQILVKVATDEGLVGMGEAWWGLSIKTIAAFISNALEPLLLGEDSSQINGLWRKMYRYGFRYGREGIHLCSLSAIDLALWDLMGKRLQVPVAQLFGGVTQEGIKAYASFPPLRKKELIQQEVERAVGAGFLGVKLHDLPVELIAAAREAAPDGYPLMVDVTGHWTPWEAEEIGKRLREYELYWLEEPVFPVQDYSSLKKIRQRVGTCLAAGENEWALSGFDALFKSEAIDYVQPQLTKIGGLSMAAKVSTLAELHNVAVSPHSYRVGPGAYANVHWALSHENMAWMEVPFIPQDLSFPVDIPELEIIDGQVQLPKGHGLGLPELSE